MRNEMLNIEATHKGFLEELVSHAFTYADAETQEIVLLVLRKAYRNHAWEEKVTTAKGCIEIKQNMDRRLAESRVAAARFAANLVLKSN